MDLKTFGQAIRELADEKGVPEPKVVETIELAVAAAYKKDYGKKGQVIRAVFDPKTGGLSFSQVKLVVDETMIKSEEEVAAEEAERSGVPETGGPRRMREAEDEPLGVPALPRDEAGSEEPVRKVRFNPERHLMLADARIQKPDAEAGQEIEFPLEARQDFGRIASQTAKQVIIQRIREAEREATYAEFKDREGEILSGIIQRIEGRNVFVDLGRGVGVLPTEEQLPRERYTMGERLRMLLLHVDRETRGPGMFLTRAHPRFLKKLFELEVPELASGVVEIKSMAREPGSRTKVAVASHDQAIDPVGSMVGQRGVRVSTVMNEVAPEKIDIIEWAEDQAAFVGNSLSPAKVLAVTLSPERREARAIVPEDQLSLAIGKGGQNVRLAAKLTGWKIDVRSSSLPAAAEAEAPDPTPIESQSVESVSPPPEASAETQISAMAAAPEVPAEESAPADAEGLSKPKRRATKGKVKAADDPVASIG